MIRLEHVSKVYMTRSGTRSVFENLSFELCRGEKFGILGRNGAGKSTLMRLISGAERPTSGVITRDMTVSWPLAFGGAFQTALSGRDNVRFITRIYNQDFAHNIGLVEEFAELGPYLYEPVRTYSQGMRARLAFAISMVIEFDCYLIDEVSAVGDARFHEKCNHELFGRRSDRAMIIVSHDLDYVRAHCQKFALIADGRMLHYESFDEAHDAHLRLMHAGLGHRADGVAA